MFVCKSKRLANYLLENQCKIIRIDEDKNNNNFLVFIFENNNLLNKVLKKWDNGDKKTYLIK